MIKYQQYDKNTCCFGRLASAFFALGDKRAELAVATRIKSSLELVPVPYKSRIDYAIDVVLSSKRVRSKGEARLGYQVQTYKHTDKFDVLAEPYNGATLLQLQDNLGNVQHSVCVARRWIFDTNFERALPLTMESLNLCCSDPDNENEAENAFVAMH